MARATSIVRVLPVALALCAGLVSSVTAQPIDPGFTHQGELSDGGSPANGNYDFRFRLYNASALGLQLGPELAATLAVTNGRYTTGSLNFTAGAFDGSKRWLEIDVRPSGGGAYTTLTPRQELTTTPHAWYANNAGTAATASNALNLGGQGSGFYTNATNLASGTLPSARLSGAYSGVLTFSNVANNYFGNGSNLTGLNATNIGSGTIADARLSSNVALRDAINNFTATDNTFAGEVGIGTASPAYPLHIVHTGGIAAGVINDGGASVPYGYYAAVDGTLTKYAFFASVAGNVSGTGYGMYVTNSTVGGRGLFASMTGTGTTYGVYVSNNSTTGYGGYFNNTATTGVTYGLYCENNSADGYGLYARHDASTGIGPAVFGRTDSTTSLAFAIHGLVASTLPGGSSAAIRGENNGTASMGIGVWGSHDGSGWGGYFTSVGGYGVYATSTDSYGVRAISTNSYGVYGSSSASYGVRGLSTDNYGVYGSSTNDFGVYGYSSNSYGGYFDTGVSAGPALYVVGTASVGVITIRGGADLAENFEFNDTALAIEPGMVVMIDDEHEGGMEIAVGAYNRRVAGIVSGAKELDAGMILGDFEGQENAKPIALTGRVWTFVDATAAAVEPGDMLTTSDTPGYAMPAVDRERAQGATIGKAMSRLNKGDKGMVLVLVNLQ